MVENEIKALVSLLDDEDEEVLIHVEQKIRSIGGIIIPFLENVWEDTGLSNPMLQKKIEILIHDLQFQNVIDKLTFWKENGAIDPIEGLWIIATYQYPDLSLDWIKREIEQIYYEVWLEFKPDMLPTDQIKVLNSVFFDKLKFGANTKNFHSASNSMLNIVLESHKGNPITLCLIYMTIAQKLGLPVFGVNLPNLFVLTFKAEKNQFYINVFNKGLIFYKSDIDNYIAQLNLNKADIFYNPCNNIDIVKRVLRNLTLAFEKTSQNEKIKEIILLMNAISNETDNS